MIGWLGYFKTVVCYKRESLILAKALDSYCPPDAFQIFWDELGKPINKKATSGEDLPPLKKNCSCSV